MTGAPEDAEREADPNLVDLSAFEATAWKAPLSGSRKVDAADLADIFAKAAKSAEAAGEAVASRVFWLLFHVCNIMLDPNDRATAFRPRLILLDGRTPNPRTTAARNPPCSRPSFRRRPIRV